MKKNVKRWLALLLAVVMVGTTVLYSSDSFLWATDGAEETAQTAEEAPAADVAGTGEVTPQEETEPAVEQQEIVVPEKPVPEQPASETPEASEPKADPVQKEQPAGEVSLGQSVEVTPSENEEDTYNVVFYRPAVEGGTLRVWTEGGSKKDVSYSGGKYTEEVKEGTTLYFEIESTGNYLVDQVKDQNGTVLTAESVNENVSVYKMVINENKEITIMYKEVPKEEAGEETETPKEEESESGKQDAVEEEKEEQDVEEAAGSNETAEKPAQFLAAVASDGARITIAAPEGALPEDAKVSALSIPETFVKAAVEDAVEAEGKELEGLKAYDIIITDADGTMIQPDESVKVTIIGAGIQGDEAAVYHVAGGSAEKIADVASGNNAAFEAEHFSIYAVAVNDDPLEANVEKSYTIGVGDTVTLECSSGRKWSWESLDSKIASVNGNSNECVVTGKSAGTATIKCSYYDGLWKSSEDFTINVVGTHNVYVYMQIKGLDSLTPDQKNKILSDLGVSYNSSDGGSTWCTIGKIPDVPISEPKDKGQKGTSDDMTTALGMLGEIEYYSKTDPTKLPFNSIKWTEPGFGLKVDGGATSYEDETGNRPTWHLDGCLDVGNMSYVIEHRDKDTGVLLASNMVDCHFGDEINADAIESEEFPGYTYDSREPRGMFTIGMQKNVITLYYTKNNYTVTYQ